ncbi:MAG: hypothetical protein ACJ8AW_15140 [Rhodopila sp.]
MRLNLGTQPDVNPAGALPGLDLLLCEREAIHVPGAIQPHGAMLAALADELLVTHASANLGGILGQDAEAALGQPLAAVIGEAACRAVQDAVPRECARPNPHACRTGRRPRPARLSIRPPYLRGH